MGGWEDHSFFILRKDLEWAGNLPLLTEVLKNPAQGLWCRRTKTMPGLFRQTIHQYSIAVEAHYDLKIKAY